jgi:hypothetical protein
MKRRRRPFWSTAGPEGRTVTSHDTEDSMAKIVFTMTSGTVHTLSNKVYGGDGPMSRQDASVQLSLATEKLRYFTVDDGTIVFPAHIATAKILND